MTTTAYSQGVAPFYDLFGDDAGRADTQLALVQRHVPAGASVLDIGAGTGSVALALAGAGYRVCALEPDAQMYAAMLTRLAARRDLEARLTPLPRAAGFALGQTFDAAVCFAVFHLINARERHTLIDHAAQHLAPGGRFLLEVAVEGDERHEQPRTLVAERRLGETLVRKYETMRRTGSAGRWLTTWELVTLRGETVIDTCTRVFEWQPCPPVEAEAMLVQHGLTIEQRYADDSGAPFVLGQSRALLLAASKR
jgi:cyclopropane fatty-acyl-phospholipid synthase-like methyltransferase